MLEKLNTGLFQLADKFGFSTSLQRGYNPYFDLKRAIGKDTKDACMLSDYLLYEYYSSEAGLFFNRDSLGFMTEIDPLVGTNPAIEKNLTLFFNDELLDNSYIQFLVIADHRVDKILDRWEGERKYGDTSLKELTKYRREFISKLALGFKAHGGDPLARDYRFFVNCSLQDQGNKSVEALLKFKKKLTNKLKTELLNPRNCDATDLIDIARNILDIEVRDNRNKQKDEVDKDREYIKPKYDVLNSLSNQILPAATKQTIEDEAIIHHNSDYVSKVYTPKELPDAFSLAEMIMLLGGENKTIPARFVISYSLANNVGAKGTSELLAQGDRVIHASSKSYTKNDLLVQGEAKDWLQIKAMHKMGEKFLSENMLVMITAPNEEIDSAQEALKSLYNSHDWKLRICSSVQRLGVLAILPMVQSNYWQALNFFKSTRYALSGDVVAKLPIQGEWKGVAQSGALLVGRCGQLFNFNPFYRLSGGGNYNIALMAPSGAGKSFFLQELAQSMISQDVSVFVMDIGASYKNICSVLAANNNAEMIRFDSTNQISLNPFASLSNSGAVYIKALSMLREKQDIKDIAEITGLNDDEINSLVAGKTNHKAKDSEAIELIEIKDIGGTKMHFVTKDSIIYAKSMISAMCGVDGQKRGEAIVERSILSAIAEHGRCLDITKLAKKMAELRDFEDKKIEGASEMADSLYPYTENGIHGRFFSAGAEASFKKKLTVFELEELVNDKPLLSVVLQVVLMQITMQFLCGDRSRKFMLIVDEAWMILDHAAHFLEQFARTVRKYGGSLVVCTQDLASFTNDCGTRKAQAAILESCTWKLILQQKEEGVQSFAKSKAYEKYIGLIESVKRTKSYSEILINTDGATIVGRLAADPYSIAMFSTESEDFNFLAGKENQGIAKHEAIKMLAQSKYGKLSAEKV